ncbi:MAG: Stk1 family PASTA domain-containing Ser/Thr kinase [Candidatus Eremiobacteraeota bacterium]|nr:Stk1 family PASTA domain-containing Ser/Thr kinase [Candidatus Eremiobacteraeota bacterium]
MIEQTFNNRYRLDKRLGEGGMATVYCGTDTLLRRRVAIKVLRQEYAADQEFVHRFYQEAESAARLSHPNIVNTYDVGREGAVYYIVMELVDGPSLAELIQNDGKLPEPIAVDYAIQLCNGLAYAHRQGLLHRDIKPANILITNDDVVKLSDFGIARAVSEQTMALTKPGLVMGSVYYLSPEQAQGHELHETSDLYSLGVVLYQMLAGKLPYSGESPVTVALKHIGDPVPTLDGTDLGVSPALAAIVNKLLQKQPGHRFQSASDVASALREARERPTQPAYALANDAPTTSFAAMSPPPRPSRHPDYRDGVMEGAERGGARWALGLGALLLLAMAVGYIFFGRVIAGAIAPPVTLGDYVGLSAAQAQQKLVNAGLIAKVTLTPSETVPADHVIAQRPDPASKVRRDSTVELSVSSGLPTIGLRKVVGFSSSADAVNILQADKFKPVVKLVFSNAPKDSVIDQNPKPGSDLREGSAVTLLVSQGPKPVDVPNLVSLDIAKASAILEKIGLKLHVASKSPSAAFAAGTVIQQDLQVGETVPPGTVVNVVQSLGAQPTTVPDVSTQPYVSAVAMLTQAGFKAVVQYTVQQDANGTIVQQAPDPGTQAPRGSDVTITLSVSGEVPDTNGLSIQDAKDRLASYGYSVGNVAYTQEGAGGRVVRTEPEAGTALRAGESVTLYVNAGGGGASAPSAGPPASSPPR